MSRNDRKCRATAVGLLVLTVVLLSVGGPGPARAASRAITDPAAAAASPSITLTGQPAWTALGGDVTFRLALANASAPNLEVRAIFYGATLSRIAFERSLDGDRLGRDVVARSVAVASMPVNGNDRPSPSGCRTRSWLRTRLGSGCRFRRQLEPGSFRSSSSSASQTRAASSTTS